MGKDDKKQDTAAPDPAADPAPAVVPAGFAVMYGASVSLCIEGVTCALFGDGVLVPEHQIEIARSVGFHLANEA